MKTAIDKDEAAWLVIRTIGLIFAWMAITKIVAFAYTAYLGTSDGLTTFVPTLGSSTFWKIGWYHASMFVPYSLLSFYFLRFGRFCHNLLCTGPVIRHRPVIETSDPDKW